MSEVDVKYKYTKFASGVDFLSDVKLAGSAVKSSTAAAAGSGMSAATAIKTSVTKHGDLFVTRIYLDIEGLNEGGTAGDIIGTNSAANCYVTQITAALNGTIVGGTVTCLEVPAGGTTDIDIYSATAATGTEDAAISGISGTQNINHGAWSAGQIDEISTMPAANDYLYLVGQGTGNTAYTAGRFLIELIGV